MRGGIPLHPRSTRQRKRKRRTLSLRLLRSGIAASVLVLYTSNQIGSTYGEFNSSQKLESSIGICTVFPSQIQQLLLEFSGHIQKIAELKSALISYPVSMNFGTPLEVGELSLEELSATAQQISEQISATHSEISVVEDQLNSNIAVWEKILQEVNSAAGLLVQIGGYMINLEPNCLEIRDAKFFQELQNNINQSGVLSESLSNSLNGVVHYLTSIHEIGHSIPNDDSEEIARQLNTSNLPSLESIVSFLAREQTSSLDVSADLLTTYEQLNTALVNSKNTLLSHITALQNQQIQITEAESELLEQAAQEEAERLELEKQEQAEKDKEQEKEASEKAKEDAKEKVKKEIENKPKKDEVPVETTDPKKNKITGDPKEASVPEEVLSPMVTPNSNLDDTPKVESIQQNIDADTAANQPSATSAPLSDTDSDKGGDL